MKNFQQNLLIVLALGLCGLCLHQWRVQTLQRNQIERLNGVVYEKSAAIQGFTNSIATMDHQIAEMDARIVQLNATAKTNEQTVVLQKAEINRLLAGGEALTNQIAEYKRGIGTLETRLKDAYDGIKKQTETLQELVVQRDDLVKKLNESVKERNEIVAKYNQLVERIEKLQGGAAKP